LKSYYTLTFYFYANKNLKTTAPIIGISWILRISLWLILIHGNLSLALPLTDVATEQLGVQLSVTNYLGSGKCAGCHRNEFKSWQGSHHARAMLPATTASVRADFSNVEVTHKKITAHFRQRDGGYYVTTQGVNGRIEEFQIKYTFGYDPLQQYLVAFPGGRLQTLPWAWDTKKGHWYYLQDPVPDPDDWLHWTRGAMNWNAMCSDCHSTDVDKNYQADSATYDTRWSEINVGCESCHGPGRRHVDLMEDQTRPKNADPAILMRPGLSPSSQVEQCGRCHARRTQLSPDAQPGESTMMNQYSPEILRPGLYHADGQINDEVFVYGSFTQSKMYLKGIACNSCHDAHSGKLRSQGNQLCTTCHLSAQYDSIQHHHHSESSQGSQCVSCHMPGKYYMGVDWRHDHSLRVPRPDLSVRFGTPNACNDCHENKNAEWAAKAIVRWFGEERRPHFSEILASATTDLGATLPSLVSLLEDQSQPAIARATAAFWLAQASQLESVQKALIKVLADQSPLVRMQAVRAFEGFSAEQRLRLFSPLLNDPVRGVRIAVASTLADISDSSIAPSYTKAWGMAQREHQAYMVQNADFASGQRYIAMHNEKLQRFTEAKVAYNEALKIDNRDTASRINLAHLHYRLKEFKEAEMAFKSAIRYEPEFGPAYYSLGLLLAELKRYKEAEGYLAEAQQIMPRNERVQKNLQAVQYFLNR